MNDPKDIENILAMRVMAVVGCSGKPDRASHQVASYLKETGYQVVPVHPRYSDVLGERCYPDLRKIPFPVDAVVIFLRSEAILPIVESAIAIRAKAVWMQDGISNEAAARLAKDQGLLVVMDDCIMRRSAQRTGGG